MVILQGDGQRRKNICAGGWYHIMGEVYERLEDGEHWDLGDHQRGTGGFKMN